MPFTRATSATNEISIAITLSMSWRPSLVPRAAALTTFASIRGMSVLTLPRVSGWPVSGSSSLAMSTVPGAVMITAVSRCRASTPKAMYAAMMDPETWAIPAVMTVISSDCVIRARNGRMVRGASV